MLAFLDRMFGLPAHPLLVHLPVVLLPVAAVALVAVAIRPSWRAKGGPIVVALLAVTLVSVQLAMSSGESLQDKVGDRALVRTHAELADPIRPITLVMLLVAAAVVFVDRRRRTGARAMRARWIDGALVALAVLLGTGSIVQIARVGHSGAKAVWHDKGTTRTVRDRDD